MNDDLANLERVMRDRAAEVPYLQDVPRNMLVRARWRIARNALSSIVAAGLIVVAASAGLASLGASRSGIPGHSTAPVPSTPSCTAADLRATAALQGAAGSVSGAIDLTNFSARTCTLTGRPVLRIFSSPGHSLPVHVVDAAPQWRADRASPPAGWPVVRLDPGSAAAIRVRWTNQCPALANPALWSVELTSGSGTLDVFGADGTYPPSCLGAEEPSRLDVGPFEPGAGG
jgi:uncharacterized protein DUF4232